MVIVLLKGIMKHPELVYLASHRCHVSLMKVIYDAFDKKRLYISARTLSAVHDDLVFHGRVLELVEDYALKLLAENERKQKQLKLPNSYEEWIKKV